MAVSSDITILLFRPENQVQVKHLILAGLAEHWGTLDPTQNLDLDDIRSTYAEAVFLVAWFQGKIVGTGALVPRSDGAAEIVRMSVATDMRRCGIGRRILEQLVEKAKASGYRRIILETTASWCEVIEFYKQCGFRITHDVDDDVYFALDLTIPT
jgi:GNAT superfamily N-acetyltransferase